MSYTWIFRLNGTAMSTTSTRFIRAFPRWMMPKQTDHSVILMWSDLRRCEFILWLGILLNAFCLSWKLVILALPSVWMYVDLDLVKYQLWFNSTYIVVLPVLIYLCRRLQGIGTARRYLPYICTLVFSAMMWRDAYIVGIFSPVTAVLGVSFIAIGLVLLNIKVLMFNIFLTCIAFIVAASLTYLGVLQYAPIFNFQEIMPYQNLFWIFSMVGLLFPVFSVCLSLMYLMLEQWREREAHFRRLSQIDGLTQVLNRRSINDVFEQLANDQRRKQAAIVLLDLDLFKEINDQYGHLTGDKVLQTVATTLGKHVRAEDLIGRYGGEEFILILQDCSQREAIEIAERCRNAIANLRLVSVNEEPLRLTASFGIALYRSPYNIYDVIHQADEALYLAKTTGRNQVQLSPFSASHLSPLEKQMNTI